MASSYRLFLPSLVSLQDILAWIGTWAGVPLLLLLVALFALWVAMRETNDAQRFSNYAAIVLAVCLGLTVVMLHRLDLAFEIQPRDMTRQTALLLFLTGFGVGLFVLHFIGQFVGSRLGPLFVVFLLTASLVSLYFYFTEDSTRMPILFVFLGVATGTLCYAVFSGGRVYRKLIQLDEPSRRRR